MPERGPGTRRTVVETWRAAVADPPPGPAFMVQARPRWREVGWEEAGRAVDEIAAGFMSIGVGRGDRVALMCRTRLEWALCDHALSALGAVVVPTYPTSSPHDCVHILSDSRARVVVCEDAAQHAKIGRARGELWALEQVVGIDPFPDADLSLEEVRGRGRGLLDAQPGAVEAARAGVEEEDLVTLVYTSGTTGPPKGCMLTHRNWWTMVDMVARIPNLVLPGDRAVLHLPLAHVFGRLVQLVGPRIGLTVAFCPDTGMLRSALQEVRPTIFPSVPAVFESVHRAVLARFEEASGVRRRLVGWARGVGEEASRRRRAGAPLGTGLRARLALADRLVLAKVRERMGGRLRVAISGGAPLGPGVGEFFHSLGLPILEGYGLTECTTVAAVNRPDRFRFGTVGPPAPDVEVRIADDGEILVRAPTVFRGYWGNDDATAAVLGDDGWLRTGDVGALDDGGFLTITDRKKDIIVTPGGENVAPQNIEGALRSCAPVSNCLVVGDRRPYLVALVTVDRDALAQEGAGPEEAEARVARAVEEVNGRLSPPERIRRFAVLPRDFLAEEGEITPTLKLRRRVVEEHFADEIARLYPAPRGPG